MGHIAIEHKKFLFLFSYNLVSIDQPFKAIHGDIIEISGYLAIWGGEIWKEVV
jgi:hypothetical protein